MLNRHNATLHYRILRDPRQAGVPVSIPVAPPRDPRAGANFDPRTPIMDPRSGNESTGFPFECSRRKLILNKLPQEWLSIRQRLLHDSRHLYLLLPTPECHHRGQSPVACAPT